MHKTKLEPRNQDTKNFARRVRALRDVLGLTQKEMGHRLGRTGEYAQNLIFRLEAGAFRQIDCQILTRLARLALEHNVSVQWLILGSGPVYNQPGEQ